MTSMHPLVPLTDQGLRVQATARPRFTMSEVLLLNAVLNAEPAPVPISALQDLLTPFAIGRRATRSSVMQHVGALRAKLGEPRYAPRHLLAVYAVAPGQRRAVGFRWVEEDEHADPV